MNKRKNQNNDDKTFKKPENIQNSCSNKMLKTNTSTTIMIDEFSKDEKPCRRNFHSLDQYTQHKLLINYYKLTHPGSCHQVFQRDHSQDKGDIQVLIENHRFIWPEEDLQSNQLTWGQRVAKKYYDRLFKEYCIIDLSLYKQNKFGMRWRTEPEVIEGKGQFICGNKVCSIRSNLTSWEVLFAYVENGEKHSALIKVKLCFDCSTKLNYHRQHKKAKKNQKDARKLKNKKSNHQQQKVEVKEEILTSDDEAGLFKNSESLLQNDHNDNDDETYEQLIDKIWRKPIKLEQESDDDQEEGKKLENDLDNYLDELFQ
ncbi:protein FRA10AC1 [Dermatophagoides pteronyssinus]|uniref:Protein FRA10AC1-like n=1 Tax=Dermatophagoides pteronyssinus TaxID=6956 RepID=A0A6P6XLS9_DERPT|nr:protein FRA10AC1-like [Dermatophagoides pteronyssinus]